MLSSTKSGGLLSNAVRAAQLRTFDIYILLVIVTRVMIAPPTPFQRLPRTRLWNTAFIPTTSGDGRCPVSKTPTP
jgi:hypothetical protein